MKKYDFEMIQSELKQVKGWKYINGAIEKGFVFPDFKEAITKMVRIAFESEMLNHHPEWTNVYNKLSIRLRTHDADGITDKDFKLAKKIDEIIEYNN